MNATTAAAMVSSITSTTKIENVTLTDDGLEVQFEKKNLSKIYFSELGKIYIKVYKLKPFYGFLFVLIPMLFAFLCFEHLELNIEMSVNFLPVIPAYIKLNQFRRFGLVIVLKDGIVYHKNVSKKYKSDTVELINEVKKKCLEQSYLNPDSSIEPATNIEGDALSAWRRIN
jgi:hypothetical protein